MALLIDTNIILDFVDERPFAQEAVHELFDRVLTRQVTGMIAAHTLTNLWYVLRKQYTSAHRRQLIASLLETFTVVPVDKSVISGAVRRDSFADFEDCIQDECAAAAHADYIITRNKKDFAASRVPALLPEELLALA